VKAATHPSVCVTGHLPRYPPCPNNMSAASLAVGCYAAARLVRRRVQRTGSAMARKKTLPRQPQKRDGSSSQLCEQHARILLTTRGPTSGLTDYEKNMPRQPQRPKACYNSACNMTEFSSQEGMCLQKRHLSFSWLVVVARSRSQATQDARHVATPDSEARGVASENFGAHPIPPHQCAILAADL